MAEMYESHAGIVAEKRAEAVRYRYVPNGKVLAYKRNEIFPEQYKKGEAK